MTGILNRIEFSSQETKTNVSFGLYKHIKDCTFEAITSWNVSITKPGIDTVSFGFQNLFSF